MEPAVVDRTLAMDSRIDCVIRWLRERFGPPPDRAFDASMKTRLIRAGLVKDTSTEISRDKATMLAVIAWNVRGDGHPQLAKAIKERAADGWPEIRETIHGLRDRELVIRMDVHANGEGMTTTTRWQARTE